MLDTKKICFNCFNQQGEETEICQLCGYNDKENREKYPTALPSGSILNGQYIIGRVLGQGGFGITYLAFDYSLNVKVAIKEFLPDGMATRLPETTYVSVYTGEKEENFKYGSERFLDEARVLAKFIGNKNIAAVKSYFNENNTAYFVMDYIEGISFKNYIRNKGGKIDYQDAMRILIPVMDALSAVHKEGFIHRDVTPDNIYITKDNEIKLLDFGSARYSLGDKSKSLDVILKAGYAPKEQYTRRGRQGAYTDIYSLAACFYSSITGYLPPEALDRIEEDDIVAVSTRGIKIPNELEEAIMKGLEVRAEDRFHSMEDFKSAILSDNKKIEEAAIENHAELFVPVQTEVMAPVQTEVSDLDSVVQENSPSKGKEDETVPKPASPSLGSNKILVFLNKNKIAAILSAVCLVLMISIIGMISSYNKKQEIPVDIVGGLDGKKNLAVNQQMDDPAQEKEKTQENQDLQDTKEETLPTSFEETGEQNGQNQSDQVTDSDTADTGIDNKKKDTADNTADMAEADRKAAEKKEAEKEAAEKKAAEKKEAAEKEEAEKKEAEKEEAEKKAAEKKEAEKEAAEKKAAEKKEAEKKAAEKKAAEKKAAAEKAAKKKKEAEANKSKNVSGEKFKFVTSEFSVNGTYTGEWKDGKPNGKGTMTMSETNSRWSKGDTLYSGNWEDGLIQGYGEWHSATDGAYTGNFKNGLKHGKGKMWFSDGTVYDGRWSKGSFLGE